MMAAIERSSDLLVGREQEMRRLRAALRERKSQLIWGPADAGKTSLPGFLLRTATSAFAGRERAAAAEWSPIFSVDSIGRATHWCAEKSMRIALEKTR